MPFPGKNVIEHKKKIFLLNVAKLRSVRKAKQLFECLMPLVALRAKEPFYGIAGKWPII